LLVVSRRRRGAPGDSLPVLPRHELAKWFATRLANPDEEAKRLPAAA